MRRQPGHTSTIAQIYPVANGSVILIFNNEAPTCQYPGSPKYFLIAVGQNAVTEAGLKHMYAAALAAAASGLSVTIYFDDSSAACPINRLLVNYNP